MNKYTIDSNFSYSLGMSLTIEALKHMPHYVKEVILSNKANKNEQLSYLLELCKSNNIIPKYDDILIDKLSLKENCYCIGIFEKFNKELESNKHIVLYGFNDYGDLGTTLRSAVSFDFKDIVLINCKLDYFNPKCVRASMGAIFHTNIISFDTIEDYKNIYKNQELIPFISSGNKELKQLNIVDNYSLLIAQDYYGLDDIFNDGYYLKHNNLKEISLSLRTSIILNYAYTLNLKR